MRIAVLGGSFDPIHNGHLQMAKYALRHLPIDEVWFMPTKATPLKERTLTSFNDRYHMIKLAIRPYRHMKVCDIEQILGETSYTIDTVVELYKRYPQYQFNWLIGGDQASQLQEWKDINRLMELVPFYVFMRDQEHVVCNYEVHVVKMPLINISSSQIREGMRLHQMPDTVRNYIGEKHLYLKTIVKASMKEQRYQHCLSVAKLSSELAEVHHVDKEKAYVAGLLHDICKEWPYERSVIWMRNLDCDLMQEHKNIWHGYIASRYIRRYLHIFDEEIGYAIRCHVKGSHATKLAMILYIADKLDPLRGYDSQDTIAYCKKDLSAGYQEVMLQQQEYLKKEKNA